MKFAVVEGQRREAQPGLTAECLVCGNTMIAKCGQHRVWHWAHRGIRTCDPWGEPETEWHRAWKNHFPNDWQEKVHTSKNGEKHVADVKTKSGFVLEFQHSLLRSGERESREVFYPKMVWVVNGRRRARDMAQFFASLGAPIGVGKLRIYSVLWNECALLRDWEASRVPVYFDFGDSGQGDVPTLWRRNPSGQNGRAHLSRVPKTLFLRAHLEGQPFEESHTEAVERTVALMQQASRSQPLMGFERYWRGGKAHGLVSSTNRDRLLSSYFV